MDFERSNRIRHVYVLGCYLRRGGQVYWKERRPGNGSGLRENQIRYEITFESSLFGSTPEERAGALTEILRTMIGPYPESAFDSPAMPEAGAPGQSPETLPSQAQGDSDAP